MQLTFEALGDSTEALLTRPMAAVPKERQPLILDEIARMPMQVTFEDGPNRISVPLMTSRAERSWLWRDTRPVLPLFGPLLVGESRITQGGMQESFSLRPRKPYTDGCPGLNRWNGWRR